MSAENNKRVSIIVPVYNAGKYLPEAIKSVKAQTYSDWELLLVDDCSTDGSAEYIRSQENDRIRLIAKEHNEGAAIARNTGLQAATGRYIAFLDADDWWDPEKLTRQLAFLREREAAFTFTAYEFADENARRSGKIVKVPETLPYRQALKSTVIFTTTVLCDTEKISKELLEMPSIKSEDTATWWNIIRHGYVAYGLNENLACYRRPPQSLSSNKVEAVRRIWNLYRKQEHLSLPYSCYNFCLWAWRAVMRRI